MRQGWEDSEILMRIFLLSLLVSSCLASDATRMLLDHVKADQMAIRGDLLPTPTVSLLTAEIARSDRVAKDVMNEYITTIEEVDYAKQVPVSYRLSLLVALANGASAAMDNNISRLLASSQSQSEIALIVRYHLRVMTEESKTLLSRQFADSKLIAKIAPFVMPLGKTWARSEVETMLLSTVEFHVRIIHEIVEQGAQSDFIIALFGEWISAHPGAYYDMFAPGAFYAIAESARNVQGLERDEAFHRQIRPSRLPEAK